MYNMYTIIETDNNFDDETINIKYNISKLIN